jgi:hypothetical protein
VSKQHDAGEPELNALAIVESLNRHEVRYVIIGAYAAIAQQAPIPATRGIDLTPETSQENLRRLSQALTELDARIRTTGVPDGLPFSHDATSLASAEMWNLSCPYGEFDISFHPAAFAEGYSQLVANAHRLRVGDVDVVVADLADVIRSKESAGRPKDLQVLPLLYRYQATRGGLGRGDAEAGSL